MGFRVYKSVKLGKGVRLNLSKSGVGVSLGPTGARSSVHSSGRRTASVGLPGSGVSYRTQSGGGSRRSRSIPQPPPAPPVVHFPKAGLLAPKDEKAFVKGVTAYMQRDFQRALESFRESMARDTQGTHIAEEYFAAFCLVGLGDNPGAIDLLRRVLESPVQMPDSLMSKYGVGGQSQISITPRVVALVPFGNLSAALMLAELLQEAGQNEEAAEILETLGSIAPDPLFGLSLADLYADLGRWEDVLRVTEDFNSNVDDVTCEVLVYRARAMRAKGLNEAALAVLKETLRSRKRHDGILSEARYERALVYEAVGKNGMARKELERLYAMDAGYRDVATRLGVKK